jgi:hypothetical protein
MASAWGSDDVSALTADWENCGYKEMLVCAAAGIRGPFTPQSFFHLLGKRLGVTDWGHGQGDPDVFSSLLAFHWHPKTVAVLHGFIAVVVNAAATAAFVSDPLHASEGISDAINRRLEALLPTRPANTHTAYAMLNTAHGVGHGIGMFFSKHPIELMTNRSLFLLLFDRLHLPSAFLPQHSGAASVWPALALTGFAMETQLAGADWVAIQAAAVEGSASYPLGGVGASVLRSALRSETQEREALRRCMSGACNSAQGSALARECAFALGLRDGRLLLMAPPGGVGVDMVESLSRWEPIECMQDASVRCVYVAAASTFYYWFELLGPFDEACCFEPMADAEWLPFFKHYCSVQFADDVAGRHACEASARAPMTGLGGTLMMSASTSRLCL